ncbi:polyphosphate polymerase domain-containing protein [bacterium]|nr:polyphosphate polymerase domain-containing protein [bacterium]
MLEREGLQLRHEFKYYIDPPQYRVLRSRLSAILQHDPHAGPDWRYHIRSLYFDDFKNNALFEKQVGVARRKKYRMRIYDYSDAVIKLEKKIKMNQYIGKESVNITREEADRILAGDVAFLAGSKSRLLRAFYLENRRNLLRPNVIVDYYREAYIYPAGNVRITFDIGLHTGLGRTDIFDRDMFTMTAIEEPGVILEVKYDNFMPQAIRGLFPSSIRPRISIGKFTICKKHQKYNDWEDN